jgi:hypothetical protein
VRIVNDFLRHLIGRELGGDTGLRPRVPALFERGPLAADAIDGDDGVETPTVEASAIERESPAQPLPWRRLRMDTPIPAAPVSARAQAPLQAPSPARASARPAETPSADESPPSATARDRRSATQRAIATPAPQENAAMPEAQRPGATQAMPTTAIAPRIETAPHIPPTAFVPLAPMPPAPVTAQRTRIAVAEADASAPADPPRAAKDAPSEPPPTLRPRPASTHPQRATMPLQSLAAARTSAQSAPEETVIQVSIGRIEVRATPQTRAGATTANSAKREAPRPTALEDYLRERQGRNGA